MNIITIIKSEAGSGILLLIATCIAMITANSAAANWYQEFKSFSQFSINDGLMVIFFLLISLELKREIFQGELSDPKARVLPAIAALGGMIVPAIIYLLFNFSSPNTLNGWAIPVATDIAFAVGIYSLFGEGLPKSLRIFLLSLAIFDDLGAILIIIFFHVHDISLLNIFYSLFALSILYLSNWAGITSLSIYTLLGASLWYFVLDSGIHPTIAGVLLGFAIPHQSLEPLEKKLNPLVLYFILPLFAFVNAGINLDEVNRGMLLDKVTLGIIFGLIIGKQVGIMCFSWLTIQFNWSRLPAQSTWLQFYGVSILCGIGFTMSLFLATLAFNTNVQSLTEARLGILIGSLVSCVLGGSVLFSSAKNSINSK